MSLKERLFGPRWEHKEPAVRAQAVAEIEDPRLESILPELALEDDAAEVRLAALKRVDREELWLAARERDADPGVRAAADSALLLRLTRAPAGDNLEARRRWLKAVDRAESLRLIAQKGADAELRRDALERIGAQGFLGDCYVHETDEQLAAEILERIDQPSTLERILGELRRHNKARRQAVEARLGRIRSEQGDPAAREAGALELIEKIEALARGGAGDDRAARLAELRAAWEALPEVPENLERRFRGAERIIERVDRPRPEPAQADQAPEPEPDPALVGLVEQARELAGRPLGKKSVAALERLQSDWDKAFGARESPTEAERRLAEEFAALAEELRARLEARRAEKSAKAEPAPEASEPGMDSAGLEPLLEKAAAALESGDVAAAHAAVSEARSFHDRLPPKQRPRPAAGRLQRMAGRLKEMRDWQHWSNNKLRERLIERVEEIDPEQLHPDAVTARLKEIRARWQALEELEVLPGDKRRYAAPPGQWRRFQAACRKAFEGARPYFEKRHNVQEQALAELTEFLDEAERVHADESTDVDTLTRYQRAARQGIRNLDALPPKSRGAMARRLRALMDGISERLETGFEAIEAEKRRLIAEARKLVHESDRTRAIEQAKALQAEWKKAGATRRKRENELWKEFREPIDPLFEGIKKERQARTEAERALREELEELCKRAEELAGLPEAEIEAAGGRMAGLAEEWRGRQVTIPALRQRFDKAARRFDERVRALRESRQRAETEHIENLASALQQAWQARLDGKPAEVTVPEARDPEDPLENLLRERLARFAEADADREELAGRVEENTEAARQIAVEMEFLAGLESPAEERKRRMDYQISRLSRRLGEGAPKPDLVSEREALARRRLESFPRDPGQHEALEKRFEKADRIIKSMTSAE